VRSLVIGTIAVVAIIAGDVGRGRWTRQDAASEVPDFAKATAGLAGAREGRQDPAYVRTADDGSGAPLSLDKPALPRTTVDVREPSTNGRTIHVAAGESLQTAIDEAKPGDRITLAAGATYEGPFRLPVKSGDGWIVIASDRLRELPAGERVDPSDQSKMPKLVAGSQSVIITEPAAHHYRFAGIEAAPAPGVFLYNLIELGSDGGTLADRPHHIIFDRSYIHGDPKKGGRRGIAMNGRDMAVIHSHLSDFKEAGADSQAVAGWNGPGPFKIDDNYLEGAGENVMFGGADPSMNSLVPSDIEITRNHFNKPLRWKIDDRQYERTPWTVKNLFELKNARRVLVEGNLLEHNWAHAQNGFAILFTPRNQDGGAPWSVVEDVTFRGNVIRHVGAGFNILGRDDNHPSRPTQRIAIANNLLVDVGRKWGGNGRLFQLLNGANSISISNNTAEQTTGGIVFGGDHDPHAGFVFQNNVMPDNGAGFVGSGTAVGRQSIDRYFPKAVIKGNVFLGGKPEQYPAGNFFAREDAPAAGADTKALLKAIDEVVSWQN
jgi:hypothetical protein